ncbi:hypothetical protein RhiirA1_540992 [Rhizophagus irregularis]|uniref:Uncharacterized protein n=2 Tax=Rhizophagus irregularis TaxID=588596 RepID=A0A2N0R5L3_9GLOM|nr:hypothetical protein RhiirA1_540992 [Rhizophagus irregularis]
MDLQMKYIYNHVIIPRVDYKTQLLVWTNSQTEKLNSTCRYMFKRKASLPLTTPNSIIHSSLGYAIKDINTIQAQRQLSRLYNQVISKGMMKDIFEIDCKQLQSELLSNKSPLATWNISLKDLQVKHCLLAHVLALLYDNMLTIKSSGVKVNQIQGGLLPIVEICTHKEIFSNGISKGLKRKNVYFVSQLMSSDGIRLLRYKDLKYRTKINTQGRIPSWFKFIETKLIKDPLKSKKVKTDYQLGYNIHSVNTKIDNLKTKNWITTFHDQTGKPIIGRVLDNPNEDRIRIEHWIQDLENDQISPSVQLPILKKCGGCVMKDIFEVDCKQLQSELLSNKFPLATWNISLKDLQVKHCLLARVLALLYDNMLTIKSSGVKVNQIQEGLIPIVEICIHKEIFTNGISKGLKGKNVYFTSQLMSSDSTRLLRYKDLKHRTKINTQDRISKHWIQDLENDQISPSVQLPILKKCGGCEVKTNQIRNKRNNTKVRCIADISIENCVKVNANSIQNDRYIADMAIYETLAQAECKYYRKTSMNECIIEKVNGLLKYIHSSDYRNALIIEIANSLMQETDIEIYTDGSMKNIATNEIIMGCTFVISAPIKKSFNCGITDNPSSNKAELMAVILNIERSKVNYKVLWLCLFKIIRIYSLKVKITKVKAHSDCDYNKEADKLAKSGAEKNVLIIEDKLLLHNGTVCWRDMPIERNPILMIKGIKDAQFIEEFLMLHRNEVYRQSDLLRLIDWKISLKLNNINQYDTLFEDHYLQSFRIKICCNELPTCANLKKRKPDLYDENWKCNFCKIEEETFDHFWKCSKIQNVVQDILIRLKIFLAKIIQEYSRDDIDIQELKVKINELGMWDIGRLYDFTFLMKNQFIYVSKRVYNRT